VEQSAKQVSKLPLSEVSSPHSRVQLSASSPPDSLPPVGTFLKLVVAFVGLLVIVVKALISGGSSLNEAFLEFVMGLFSAFALLLDTGAGGTGLQGTKGPIKTVVETVIAILGSTTFEIVIDAPMVLDMAIEPTLFFFFGLRAAGNNKKNREQKK
jgi:hypothetical protein